MHCLISTEYARQSTNRIQEARLTTSRRSLGGMLGNRRLVSHRVEFPMRPRGRLSAGHGGLLRFLRWNAARSLFLLERNRHRQRDVLLARQRGIRTFHVLRVLKRSSKARRRASRHAVSATEREREPRIIGVLPEERRLVLEVNSVAVRRLICGNDCVEEAPVLVVVAGAVGVEECAIDVHGGAVASG